jgi:hypothetical protein
MTRILFTIITIATLVFSGCDFGSEKRFDTLQLRALIVRAISGDNEANKSIGGMLSTQHIGKNDYNQLIVDSFYIDHKPYYSVLLEYFDPVLNIFAIYNSELNLFLIDYSLNGNLSVEWAKLKDRNFVILQERFLTKDVLVVDRISIYEVFSESAMLVYRALSRFVMDKDICYQNIETISDDFIVTKLRGLKEASLNNQTDTFYFNAGYKKYLSRWNLFNNYVKQEIKEFDHAITKPQIPSQPSGISDYLSEKGFEILLDKEWEEQPDFTEEKFLKKSLSGTKFFNKTLSSEIIIMQIPKGEKAESYCPYKFGPATKGIYQIRSTAIYEIGNNFLQIFEHNCGKRKFLMLFNCPKTVYVDYKKNIENLLSTFVISCS